MTVFLILLILAAGAFGFRHWSKQRAHKSLLTTALSVHQRGIIAEQVPLTRKLPTEFREALEGKINAFLNQVEFIGCNGLEVSEEMQLSISAQACLLIVNSDAWYKNLHTILIYPDAFKSQQTEHSGYVVMEREIVRTGESWSRGPVVLSWAHTKQGAINDKDGHNVVFHEFAHQIDDLSGRTNGIPILSKSQNFADWGHVFVKAYESHVQHVRVGSDTVFDPYGATGPEEFFAVAVEIFFERPVALKRREPAVYEQLALLFRLEPSTW
jgi:Mlc titration factor MtfA (ptsG expression regulator)